MCLNPYPMVLGKEFKCGLGFKCCFDRRCLLIMDIAPLAVLVDKDYAVLLSLVGKFASNLYNEAWSG